MKKIIVLFCLLILVCGCKNKSNNDIANNKETIVFPTEKIAETLNGYKTENDESTQESTDIVYIANTNSKKFHLSDCSYAKNIKQENALQGKSRNYLINNDYTPCKSCNP